MSDALFHQVHELGQHQAWKALSGSRAYGLDTPTSDTDIKGVFVLPKRMFYGWSELTQVSNPSNDVVYYELGRFFELLAKNNPNILELLSTSSEHVFFKHELMQAVQPKLFFSKLCQQTFAGYAVSQIKKAQGLNKKIVNPVDETRKSVADFCYVALGASSMPLKDWLKANHLKQHDCGLVAMPHMRELYAVYHSSQGVAVRGIYSDEYANHVSVSPLGKDDLNHIEPLAMLSFNKDGYSSYCREYKSYWQWVKERNQARYESTMAHGKSYDAKNMMHTFRLLHMAQEIAREHKVQVRRPDREFLLRIKSGEYLYDELVQRANDLIGQIEDDFARSDLPETPDPVIIEQLLVETREQYYQMSSQYGY